MEMSSTSSNEEQKGQQGWTVVKEAADEVKKVGGSGITQGSEVRVRCLKGTEEPSEGFWHRSKMM